MFFYAGNDRYSAPKMSYSLILYSAVDERPTAKQAVTIEIIEKLIVYNMRRLLSSAEDIEDRVIVDLSPEGMTVHVSGYSETVPTLLRRIFNAIRTTLDNKNLDLFNFINSKEDVEHMINQNIHNKLFIYASEQNKKFIQKNYFTLQQLKQAMPQIGLVDVLALMPLLFRDFCYEALISGDISEDNAKQLSTELIGILGKRNQADSSGLKTVNHNVWAFDAGIRPVVLQKTPAPDHNNLVVAVFQAPADPNIDSKLLLHLLNTFLSDDFFTQLRTNL